MNRRIGVIGIVVEERGRVVDSLNRILSQHAGLIIGRMGIPYREHDISVISIIVDGTTDQIGSLTGKLGNLEGVTLKSALTSREIPAD
ncbi:MAG: TM1266 family iron-only hydrogenase system putative regulator [Bacillota bacterium]